MNEHMHIIENNTRLLITDAQGIYLPQVFANAYGDHPDLVGANANDLQTISAGPDHEHYWEAWNSILDNATLHGKSLHQDGHLWLIDYDSISAACDAADIDCGELWDHCR